MRSKTQIKGKTKNLADAKSKNESVLLKSSLLRTRKIIADKFRKLRQNKVLSERKSLEKYKPLSDSLQKIIAQKGEINQNQQTNDPNVPNHIELGEDIDVDDGPPPPPYPPPQLPPPIPPLPLNRHQLPIQHVRPLPPLPARSKSYLKRSVKRPHSMISHDGDDDDVINIFEPNHYRNKTKLRKKNYDPMVLENNKTINEHIEINDVEDPEAGAWGGARPKKNKTSSSNNLLHDDDAYVEIIRKTAPPNKNSFIANALNLYKKNRINPAVLPDVRFAKLERKRGRDKKQHDPNLQIDSILQELNHNKAEALNNDNWNDSDEHKYKAVTAILSPDDFDEDGKFIGGAQKRRKITLAASKFNIESIKKIKSQQKKGKGLQKNFIPYVENIVYEYWDDPNELCERLKLLLASKSAGNSNHDQEINSIIEELRERKIIS